jgi:Asp-tRNA(Asn)/Glu-tRNA(Gln) amidotransferase A subunit family amidase
MLAQKLEGFFRNYDVIVTLSTAGQAPDREVFETDDSCLVWTLCGQPVIGIPQFKSPEGLPFGFQAVGRRYNDYLLLKFAKQLRDWGLTSNAQTAECLNPSPLGTR